MSDANSPQKLPLATKVGYGAAEFSSSLTWTMLSILFLFFLTDAVGMEPAFAGLVMMIGTLWDAVTDPTIGIVSDRMRTRWGRRRPFLLAVAIPYGLITWLLFTDFGLGESLTKLYFVMAIMLYYTAATFLEVPYSSLAAEMTQDYDERTSLFSFRAAFSQLASIVGAGLPWLLIAYFSKIMGGEKAGWSTTSAIFGVLSVGPILWTWRTTRGHELHPEDVTVRLKDILHGPLQNRTFLFTMGICSASYVALSAAGAVMVYFMKYYLNLTETQGSAAFLFLFAGTLLWIPIVTKTSFRFGKRASFICFIGLWAVIQAVATMVLQPSMTILFYVLMILSSGGVISVSLTGFSMVPDAVEVDEFKSGQRREGLYVGVFMFSKKFSVAFVLWLIGITLSWVGYVPDQVQTDQAILGIRLLYGPGTALFLCLSIILAWLLPMTRQRHEALKQAIRLKNEGKPWDEDSIRAIL